jgi:glycosyltransferase involved in cell wall biosynthesis
VLVERDPEAVGRALATLALDPERRRAMGAAARSRSEPYTWDAVAGRVLAAYEEVAGRRAEASRR